MQGEMAPTERLRDYESERCERDSFVFLQHVYTLSGGGSISAIAGQQVARQLGFTAETTQRLMEHLVAADFLTQSDGGNVSITKNGRDYIERAAQRRRSVRLLSPRPI